MIVWPNFNIIILRFTIVNKKSNTEQGKSDIFFCFLAYLHYLCTDKI